MSHAYICTFILKQLSQMRFGYTVILLVTLLCGTALAQKQVPVKEDETNGCKQFSSAEGQFTVCLPGIPIEDIAMVGTTEGPRKTHFFALHTDQFLYYISYADLSAFPKTPEENKIALDETRDRTAANGTMLSENDVTFDGILAKEVVVDRHGLILKGRFFYAKGRLYHLILTAHPEVAFRNGKLSMNPADRTELFETASKRFFESFKLMK